MILTNIHAAYLGQHLPQAIQDAIAYLRNTDFLRLPLGRYDIHGDSMFANYHQVTSRPKEQVRAEVHRRYIDVQYWLEGEELFGFAPCLPGFRIADAEPDRDFYYVDPVPGEILLPVRAGDIVILFHDDIHRPGIQKAESLTYKKVAVKVDAALL